MNVSAPVSCPAQTCNEPAKFVTFCYLIIITTFPDIFLNTFPTPRGLIKPELLLRDINLDAATAPNDEQSMFFDAFSKITSWRVLQWHYGDLMLLFQNVVEL